jgi:hypothetical protein
VHQVPDGVLLMLIHPASNDISTKRNGSSVIGIVSADYHPEFAFTSNTVSPPPFMQIQFLDITRYRSSPGW